MGYTALYRKFRPQTFAEMVGQEHITRTLRNQIMANRVGHAYLFNGGRGTGKTTSAKVLARAINCLNPKDGDACNECENCKLITEKEKIKCVLVLLSSDICIGRIIGKDFDSFTKVTIIHKIPFRHLIVKINEAVSSKVLLIGDDRWNFENFLHVDFFHQDTAKTISTIIDDHRGIAINLELSLIESFIENSISCVMEK